MFGDVRVYLFLSVFGGGVIYGIFQAPPLTSRETDAISLVEESSFEVKFEEERAHCEELPDSFDCQCYARVSGVVQSGDRLNIVGAERVDPERLARMQAEGRC
ncbi:MAG: hypothetical protein OXC60_08100 [Litoreibacter sp.]|nr:hypothetical protein [Litoreibacter sp.]